MSSLKDRVYRKRKLEPTDKIEEELNLVEEKIGNEQFDIKTERDKAKRLEYLLKQTSIYAHFVSKNDGEKNVAGGSSNKSSSKKKEDEYESCIDTEAYETTPFFIENGEMRSYQIDGLNWLISLYGNGVNGILADEMGLGKTLQTISMLGHLKHVKKINGPFLIVVPKSTISSWVNEIKKWCPSLSAFALVGTKQERENIIRNKLFNRKMWDICLTTYEICCRNKSNLKDIKWNYLVVDEAHRIKNENSLLSKTVRSFESINRLLLTGTPLQNNLHEFWALLNFILPDIFYSSNDFDSWFDTFDCLENKELIQRLHSVCKPFMLQRYKNDVEKALLPKKEFIIYVGVSELQRNWYIKTIKKDINVIRGSGDVRKKPLNFLLLHLLKVASHPYLMSGAEPEPFDEGEHLVNNSGKMIVLDKLLKKLKEQGSRVVIFGHFVNLLDILEDYCRMREYKYLRLDGSTSHEDRTIDINEFNAPGSDIFLYIISTTAGGLGINLQTADVVILLQSHFNPQVDLQAIDRVHRIGQKKQVQVFRLISENTVEEKLIARAEVKLKLNEVAIQNKKLSKDELMEIIHFGVDKITNYNNLPIIKDEYIDEVLKCCKENTASGSFRFQKYNDNNNNKSTKLKLLNIENYHETEYIYQFQGKNYKQRKDDSYSFLTNYNKLTKFKDLPICKKDKTCTTFYDFQFLPEVLHENQENLDKETYTKLLSEGFPDWNKKDFHKFIEASKKYGRDNLRKICQLTGKSTAEIKRYHEVFWKRCHELEDTSILDDLVADQRIIKV